ncbi:hypothetical protein EUTSA_v10009673mg [Eutrema salsugineum]|uniref:Probable purine permease n=1 Tax=Eutrema salsugineum TaxID=72664 RepID=V4MQR9_EUTSA|nr:hypothetical protein EUTSA_v10009673mg [Eutrema salsugineum]
MGRAIVIINCIVLAIGNCGGPLIMRLYFNNGGKSIWFSTFLETAGFPIIFIPLLFSYLKRRRSNNGNENTSLFLIKPRLLIAAVLIGILSGFDNYLYAYGIAYLPVSTAALIIASQLAFIAIFSYFMVNHKFTPFTINAVVLLTVGAAVLGMHTETDKPVHETHKQYIIGFLVTVAAAVMYAFVLPLVELAYQKAKQPMSYSLVLEVQLILCFLASLVSLIGLTNRSKRIQAWRGNVLCGGCGFSHNLARILLGSHWIDLLRIISRLGYYDISPFAHHRGLSCYFYHEKFQAEKGLSLALSLWGFVSYFYGEIKANKENKRIQQETELISLPRTISEC